MSFISALKEITGYKFPLIIDTPLGRVSARPRFLLSQALPKFLPGEQLLFLATGTEFIDPLVDWDDDPNQEGFPEISFAQLLEKNITMNYHSIRHSIDSKTATIQNSHHLGRKTMDNDDINFPDVSTGTKNTPKYRELTEEKEFSPFYGKDYAHVFLFSMAYAFAHKLVPKAVSGEKNMPAKRFHAPERNMMRALAVEHTDDLNLIKDSAACVKICEEYANAGFQESLRHNQKHRC